MFDYKNLIIGIIFSLDSAHIIAVDSFGLVLGVVDNVELLIILGYLEITSQFSAFLLESVLGDEGLNQVALVHF